MSEQTMRARVVRALRPLDAIPVENRVRAGTPDVNFIGGWMELKWARRWPRSESTPLRVDHFNPVQRAWLRRRDTAGEPTWVLLQVGACWLLIAGPTAAHLLGTSTRATLVDAATAVWDRGLIDKELVECLRDCTRSRGPES